MLLLSIIRVFSLVVLVESARVRRFFKRYDESCTKLSYDPYFEPEMVIGKPWRIYYTWHMRLQDKCLDMKFKKSTPAIVNRIYSDMYEYLENQPYWDAATLLASLGLSNHEMLLFADQGPAGRFLGVPDVVRDGNIAPKRNEVPLFKIQMKVILEGKFLVMSDCNIGVSTLSARRDSSLSRHEILTIANSLELGEGHFACITEEVST